MRLRRRPDFHVVGIFIDNVVQVEFQSFGVGLLNSFQNIDNDACETVCIEIDFLVVWYLSNLAVHVLAV